MKSLIQRFDKLEIDFKRLDSEIINLRDFKHAANGTLHTHNGKLEAIEGHNKSIVGELSGIRTDINLWMAKTDKLLTWQLKVKFVLLGGTTVAGVGLSLMGAAYYILTIYLNYKK